MHTSLSDLLFKLGVLTAVVVGVYTIATREADSFDPEYAIDLLVDSGLNLQETKQDLELLDQRKILITSGINAQSSRIIIEKLLLLEGRDGSRPIDLYLRTEGGWEADAFSIIDTMRSLHAPVNIHAIGEVHSAGLMILAAGTGQRIVYPSTILGFHALAPEDEALWQERYHRLWKDYSQLPDRWLDRSDGEFEYFTAAESLKYGVADVVFSSEKTTPR